MKNKLELIIILLVASALLLLANNFFEFQKMTGNAIKIGDNNPNIIITIATISLICLIIVYYKFMPKKTKKKR